MRKESIANNIDSHTLSTISIIFITIFGFENVDMYTFYRGRRSEKVCFVHLRFCTTTNEVETRDNYNMNVPTSNLPNPCHLGSLSKDSLHCSQLSDNYSRVVVIGLAMCTSLQCKFDFHFKIPDRG